ncbi:NAD(P)-dependent oxidoreductase [Marinobacter changyiensis]|uniref:NAD(P)-dependent oxidoreductase n=1 Tax=Marinobacter changyiensis TaxID=2604091 RepID=UPI0012650CF0|nr:NAD(P)-dependent oxidoreductase [Marinobacter changyiensis]
MSTTVTFLGLGVMGFPMAGHLAHAGFNVRVYNRTAAKSQQWAEQYAGTVHADVPSAVAGAEVILTCVGADPDLISLYEGPDGIIANAAAGAVLVDHTTASADVAEHLAAKAREAGLGFVDAPVSGGQQGAENGQLTIMCGGSDADFSRAKPVMNCYAKALNLMGPVGSGQKTKMVNQIAIAGLLQGLSEALHFAERAGLDAEKVVEVISQGAAQSWQMNNRAGTMLAGKFDHGFAVDWMRKDLSICLDEAERNGAALPATALVDQFYGDVQAMGGRRWDTSSLLERLRRIRPV